VFWISQQQYASGGGNTDEVHSHTFHGENPRSGLIVCTCNDFVEGIVDTGDYL
jgi:hypothetical protein